MAYYSVTTRGQNRDECYAKAKALAEKYFGDGFNITLSAEDIDTNVDHEMNPSKSNLETVFIDFEVKFTFWAGRKQPRQPPPNPGPSDPGRRYHDAPNPDAWYLRWWRTWKRWLFG